MIELNDNIDHKNVVINWISLCLPTKKNIFLRACIKDKDALTF